MKQMSHAQRIRGQPVFAVEPWYETIKNSITRLAVRAGQLPMAYLFESTGWQMTL